MLDKLKEKRKRTLGGAGRELEEDIEAITSVHDAIKHAIPLLEQKLMMLAPYISEGDIAEQGTLAKALGGFIRLSRTYVEHKKLWTSLRNKYGTEHASVKASIVGYMQRIAQDEKPSNFEVVSSMQRISFPKQITSFCVSNESKYTAIGYSKYGTQEYNFLYKDPNRELDHEDKDPNSNPLYSGMNQDPNVLHMHSLSPTLSISLPVTNTQVEITPPLSPTQPPLSPPKKSGGLFAKIRALSSSSGSVPSSTEAAANASKQKPRLLLSRIRENRLTRKEVISDSNEMCIRKLCTRAVIPTATDSHPLSPYCKTNHIRAH